MKSPIKFKKVLLPIRTAVVATLYIRSSHISLGRIPCWYIEALYFPGNPMLSTILSHDETFSCVFDAIFVCEEFVKPLSHAFNYISYYWRDLLSLNLHPDNLLTRPFLNTRHIGFFGLNFIRAQEMLSSNDGTSHLNRICVVVITVWSSMSSHQLSNLTLVLFYTGWLSKSS